jgi:hypothetical protein
MGTETKWHYSRVEEGHLDPVPRDAGDRATRLTERKGIGPVNLILQRRPVACLVAI